MRLVTGYKIITAKKKTGAQVIPLGNELKYIHVHVPIYTYVVHECIYSLCAELFCIMHAWNYR